MSLRKAACLLHQYDMDMLVITLMAPPFLHSHSGRLQSGWLNLPTGSTYPGLPYACMGHNDNRDTLATLARGLFTRDAEEISGFIKSM